MYTNDDMKLQRKVFEMFIDALNNYAHTANDEWRRLEQGITFDGLFPTSETHERKVYYYGVMCAHRATLFEMCRNDIPHAMKVRNLLHYAERLLTVYTKTGSASARSALSELVYANLGGGGKGKLIMDTVFPINKPETKEPNYVADLASVMIETERLFKDIYEYNMDGELEDLKCSESLDKVYKFVKQDMDNWYELKRKGLVR